VFPRFAHVVKNNSSAADKAAYDIYAANLKGDANSGVAQPFLGLSREQVIQWLTSEGVGLPDIETAFEEIDREGRASIPMQPRVGPRIVRAWFDTVINPLIGALDTELQLLDKGNWTWRFRPPSLELIRPARRYLEPAAAATLEQVCHLNPPTRAIVSSHDVAVRQAFEIVAKLHEALTNSPEFVSLCDSLWAPQALAAIGAQSIGDVFGAYQPEDEYQLVAQYVVNHVGDLPAYYTTSKFWNRHRDKFLEMLNRPPIDAVNKSQIEASGKLQTETRQLLSHLDELRLNLSLQHDVPYVTSRPAELAP